MNSQRTIIIDTDHLTGVAESERDWLERWLHASKDRHEANITTVACASAVEAERVVTMLTRRGMPGGAMLTRGGA